MTTLTGTSDLASHPHDLKQPQHGGGGTAPTLVDGSGVVLPGRVCGGVDGLKLDGCEATENSLSTSFSNGGGSTIASVTSNAPPRSDTVTGALMSRPAVTTAAPATASGGNATTSVDTLALMPRPAPRRARPSPILALGRRHEATAGPARVDERP
jgi:hypothetical protein